MNKMFFENSYVLIAEIKRDVKLENDKWVELGTSSLRITLLTDVIDNDLATGKVKYITSVKEPKYDINALFQKLNRFARVNVVANVIESSKGDTYKFTKIECDGVDLTSASTLTPADDTQMPF